MLLEKETALFQKDKIKNDIESLQDEVSDTSSYFWHQDGSGTEAGAHVTEVPQVQFKSNPSGGNLLLQSNSIKIRRATTILAELTNDGLTVYKDGTECASFGATTKITSGTNRISIDSGGIGGGLQFQKYKSTIIDPDSRWSTVWNADEDGIFGHEAFYIGATKGLDLVGKGAGINLYNGTIDLTYAPEADPGITISGYEPFKIYREVIDNYTIAAGAYSTEEFFPPDGAFGNPLCVVGFNVENATSGGIRSSNIYVRGAYLNSDGNGVLKIVNSSSQNSAKIKMTVLILYERFSYL